MPAPRLGPRNNSELTPRLPLLQVGYFKATRRLHGEGRRLFRMAPLHHHLELCGWPELKVTNALVAASAVLAGLALAASALAPPCWAAVGAA